MVKVSNYERRLPGIVRSSAKTKSQLSLCSIDSRLSVSEIEVECLTDRNASAVKKKVKVYLENPFGLRCCSSSRGFDERKEKSADRILKCASQRNHTISNFDFKNTRNCTFDVFCRTRNLLHTNVAFDHYEDKRVKGGGRDLNPRLLQEIRASIVETERLAGDEKE